MGVGDYDEIERHILDTGGKVALPKMALVGMAWQGYHLDTDGNTFGIHQPAVIRSTRYRVRSRSIRIGDGGTKLGCSI